MSVRGWSRMSALCCVCARFLPVLAHHAKLATALNLDTQSAPQSIRGARKLANEARRGSNRIRLRLEDELLILVFLLGSPNLQGMCDVCTE